MNMYKCSKHNLILAEKEICKHCELEGEVVMILRETIENLRLVSSWLEEMDLENIDDYLDKIDEAINKIDELLETI